MPTQSGVYALSNSVTGNAYVGSTKDLANRKANHFWQLRNRRHRNHLIQADFDQYGAETFEFTVLEHAPCPLLREIEQRHIDSGQYTYNLAPKASGGGAQNSQTIPRMKAAHTGKRHSPETIAKLKARPRETTGSFTGYYLTPTGRYASSYDAAEAMGNVVNFTTIRRWCKNPAKRVCKCAFGRSQYLKSFGKSVIGRTFGDLGFGFEPVRKATDLGRKEVDSLSC